MSHFTAPTDEEWEKIQAIMLEPEKVPRETVGVIRQLMATTGRTEYDSFLAEGILRTFAKQMTTPGRGVALQMNHPSISEAIPLGLGFDAEVQTTNGKNEYGAPYTKLFGKFFIQDSSEEILSLGTPGFFGGGKQSIRISTEWLAQKYAAGAIRGGSVGFVAKKITCSICGADMRQGDSCKHATGKEYDGKMCGAVLDDGELREHSLVLRGGIPEAGAVVNYGSSTDIIRLVAPLDNESESLNCGTTKMCMSDSGTEGDSMADEKLFEFMQKAAKAEVLELQVQALTAKLGDFEKMSTRVAEAEASVATLTSKVEVLTNNLTAAEEWKTKLTAAVAESGVQAYGQEKDPQREAYATMEVEKLVECLNENVRVFFSVTPPGVASSVTSAPIINPGLRDAVRAAKRLRS